MSGVELVTEWIGWHTILLEKMVGAQLAKNFPAFYRTRGFITLFARTPPLVPFSMPDESSSWAPRPPRPISINFILLLLSHLLPDLESGLCTSGFTTKTLHACLLSPML